MDRKALISRHIVIPTYNQPVFGAVLIENEFIAEVMIFGHDISISQITKDLRNWNPIDLEDYYISPGLIDINIRREWEDYTTLTQSAISGGCTLLMEEVSAFHKSFISGKLFCDIGSL